MKKQNSIALSLALITTLGLNMTGCGGSSSDNTSPAASSVDVTVERGKVYGATVVDSSTPIQTATQKDASNVYTFAKTPTYPIKVTGGWIDVNNDGTMDVNDVKLDIEMKSYSNVVTPVTTYIADANETVRAEKLAALLAELNSAGVGADSNVTAEDLLKVPSEAPRDVMVLANAIFKDIKETNTTNPINDVMAQFNAINSGFSNGELNATEVEQAVMTDLETNGQIMTVTYGDISQNQLDNGVALSPIAQMLIDGRISSSYFFLLEPMQVSYKSDFTIDGYFPETWMVQDNVLTISGRDGDRTEVIFESANPSDGSEITVKGYYGYGDPEIYSDIINIAQPATTEPSTGSGDTTGGTTTPTTVDLSAYSSILIYKKINATYVDTLNSSLNGYAGFHSEATASTTSCEDFGFSNPTVGANVKTYYRMSPTVASCVETDYAAITGASGSSNALVYYNNN